MNREAADKYCETHEMFNVKNAVGRFVCPFCDSNLEL